MQSLSRTNEEHDAWQSTRANHRGRTSLPRPHPRRRSAEGLGQQHARMIAWLDENCGADGWAMAPSGTRGVLNDALSIYFPDPALAGAFVARWCIGYKVETAEGAFRVREDEPAPRVGAGLHRTP